MDLRYCQWLGRGNFGRRWYNVRIWSDFGVQGCRPCFSYPCQNLLVPLSKVNDDLTIIRLHWSTKQSSFSFNRPNYLLRTLLYCTHHCYSILLHALVRSFSSSGALWAQEGLSTLTCKTSCAKQDTSKLLYWKKTAWDVRRIMYFYLCCDISWYSSFRYFALVCWKSSMFKDYCAVAWAWESDSFCISCCFTWSNLNKQRLSIAFPAAIWMMILFSSILMQNCFATT